jgi:hypothetical protein
VLVNRFSRRMLDSVTGNTGDARVKASVGSATAAPTDVLPEVRGDTSFRPRPLQDRTTGSFATQLSTRMWRDRGVALKLCAGTVFCFACVGVVAAVVYMTPVEENIAVYSSASSMDPPANIPERRSMTDRAALPGTGVAAGLSSAPRSPPEEASAVPAEPAPTAVTTPAAPTLEEALAVKMPARSLSLAALRLTTEVAAPMEASETVLSTAIPPLAKSPTGAAPIAMAVSATATPNEADAFGGRVRRRPNCASRPRKSLRC